MPLRYMWLPGLLVIALILTACTGLKPAAPAMQQTSAGAVSKSVYDARETFAPLTLPNPVNAYRSADGTPGPDYWQNRADYKLAATLDPAGNTLTADETITYTNNSPALLDSLWIQLDQNIYREDARAHYASSFPRNEFTRGFVLDAVETEQAGVTHKADYIVSDTRLQIRLHQPLTARGGVIQINIRYHYEIPGKFGGRTGHATTQNGEIYDIAQWYPRMAVYDDIHGWDTLPYTGAEFYLEYGDFDYAVTVPWDMLVAGSGELVNPDEVLTTEQRRRLAAAHRSDKTVMIRTPAEVTDPNSRPVQSGTLTWRFHMSDTRDVAFAASSAYVWDAARINLPGGKTALAQSVYPVEGIGKDAWNRSTEYIKHAVENFSRRWSAYPYPVATNIGGPVDGMEYPGVAFDSYEDKGYHLFYLAAHEIGHTWFPMLVGVNERRHQWMDEGFNTFIDVYESEDFGEYGPKHDKEYAPGGGNPVDEILQVIDDPGMPAIMTRAEQVPYKDSHPLNYFKSALGLVLLREQVLGKDRFDWAFRKFIRDWSFKHPTPSDFFRTMESAAGEDLSWFWRGWFFNNWKLDLAVQGAEPDEHGWDKGAIVTITNLQPMVMPATVEIIFADGGKQRTRLPVESWLRQGKAVIRLNSTQPITQVTVDPDHVLPDDDRSNNTLKVSG